MKSKLLNMAGSLLLFAHLSSIAQTDDTKDIIRKNDSLFWVAYNHCDLDGMHQFIADDVEFYHDNGGILVGWEQFAQTTKKNLCTNYNNWHLRREAVPGSVSIYAMQDNNKTYGAVISGSHYFYINEAGKKEYRDGLAKFTHLWLLKDGKWKMARILSFDHGPAPYENGRKEIQVSAKTLKDYVGNYDSRQGAISVTADKNSLVLSIEGNKYTLFPESENRFFSKERDLTFEFTNKDGKVDALTIRENGNVLETDVKTR